MRNIKFSLLAIIFLLSNIIHGQTWSTTSSNLYFTGGNVGIGTTNPNYALEIIGNVVDSGSLFATNITGNSISLNSGVITSPSNKINFAGDTIITAATVKAPLLLLENPGGNTSSAASISLWQPNVSGGNMISSQSCSCTSPASAMTFSDCGFIFGNFPVVNISNQSYPINNTFVGIGTANPDAGLSVSTSCLNQFSAINPYTLNDVFTIDQVGNTYAAGNVGIATTTPNSQLNINVLPNPSNTPLQAFSVTSFNTEPIFTVLSPRTAVLSSSPMGLVGIGTSTPQAVLEVFQPGAIMPNENLLFALTYGGGQHVFAVDNVGNTNITGQVAIYGGLFNAPIPNTYALNVGGTIWCNEVKVCIAGCDFVFDKEYKLMPLNDLEQYLALNHHLPGIASAKEMESSDGVELGKMNSQLLQKVEELTLYTIELKKQLDEMQTEITKLKGNK